jgi:hypothetical protein
VTEANYVLVLRKLSSAYYQNRIGFAEYRIQRKKLLDKIDAKFNGGQPNSESLENQD